MAGRPALVPLSPPATLDADGRPVGEVAGLFEDWLTARQAANRIASAKTLVSYRSDLARWAYLLVGPGDTPGLDRLRLADLRAETIAKGLAAMNQAGLSVAARQRALAALRGFCRWLVRHDHLAGDPTADEDLAVKGDPAGLPASFTDDELGRITHYADTEAAAQRRSLRWPARDQATLALLAGCGLRSSEVCALTWQRLVELDVAGDARVVIRGKGRRVRTVPLSPTAATVLQTYRDERVLQAATNTALKITPRRAVIVQTDGRPITPAVLDRWVTRWLTNAGVTRRQGAAAHAFRHTAADGWLNNAATLAEVQALLGHASIATTGIYTKARPGALADVVRAGRYEHGRP